MVPLLTCDAQCTQPSSSLVAPPVMWTLVEINPINTIVISTINHSYWSYVHQLSYRLGGPSSSLALQFLWVVPDPAPWSHWNWCSSKLNARGPRLKLVAGLLSWCLFPIQKAANQNRKWSPSSDIHDFPRSYYTYTYMIRTNLYLVGGIPTLWKIWDGKDDIPYMKWKIIQPCSKCSKPPTSQSFFKISYIWSIMVTQHY